MIVSSAVESLPEVKASLKKTKSVFSEVKVHEIEWEWSGSEWACTLELVCFTLAKLVVGSLSNNEHFILILNLNSLT